MLFRLSGSLVGIATSAFFISNKAYAKDVCEPKESPKFVDDEEAAFRKLHTPKIKWDANWDHRDPKAIFSKLEDPPGDKCPVPSKSRHLYLVRHGQYHMNEKKDENKKLTELGRKQAEFTGKRLKELNLTFDRIIISTMPRAVETGEIIVDALPDERVKTVQFSEFIREGSPVPPEPPTSNSRNRAAQDFYRDGARIEAAFRRYFHRASPAQKNNEQILLVCHANVIRYFVCRALQIPEEAWLRFSLKNGSITHIEIRPSGRIVARAIGDAGFMPLDMITTT